MSLVDVRGWKGALERDGEFRLAARHWTGRLRIDFGEAALLVKLFEGRVVEVDEAATPYDAWDFEIAAAADEWREFLRPVPRPFYHDVFAASLHHGFRLGGDLESMYAYYPATRRMLELMRDHAG